MKSSESIGTRSLTGPDSADAWTQRWWGMSASAFLGGVVDRQPAAHPGPWNRLGAGADEWAADRGADVGRWTAAHSGPLIAISRLESGSTVERLVDATEAAAHYASGGIVVAHRLDWTDCRVRAWAAEIAQTWGVESDAVQASAFLVPRGAGMPKHCDPREVVSLHVAGERSWSVAPNVEVEHPTGNVFPPATMDPAVRDYAPRGMSADMPDSARAFLQAEGSVLYVPRGDWHSTLALSDSASVSFGIARPTRLEAIWRRLARVAYREPSWRELAPIGGSAPSEEEWSRLREVLEKGAAEMDKST